MLPIILDVTLALMDIISQKMVLNLDVAKIIHNGATLMVSAMPSQWLILIGLINLEVFCVKQDSTNYKQHPLLLNAAL